MEVKFKIEDHLSEEEIKDICKDAIRQCIYNTYQKESDVQRLICNLTYDYIFKLVDECIGESAAMQIKEKIPEIINDLSSFSVFRQADEWNRNNSTAYDILEEEVKNFRPLIKQRIEQIVNEYPFHEVDREEIGYVIHDCIMDRLFGEEKNE